MTRAVHRFNGIFSSISTIRCKHILAFQLGHPKAFELASKLIDIAPDGIDHAFFVNSGSEAVETAMKMTLAYHRIRGQGERTRFIGRERGYHGVGFAGVLKPKMDRAFPQLKGKKIEYEWGGYIGISMNRIPQMGRIQDNTYYVQGYSGHGLCPSHIAGNVIADAIAGDSEQSRE